MTHYSRKQKSRGQRHGKTNKRNHSHSKRRFQKGGSIITPAMYSNLNNAHFSGFGFTDLSSAKTGCTGSTSSPAALRGADIYTTIGGIKTPVTMKGGARKKSSCSNCNQRKRACKNKSRRQRGGGMHQNTNGYSIGGVQLRPNLSGIATNYHTAYDSCKG